jgi:hypothetical protein
VAEGLALHEPLPQERHDYADRWNAAIAALEAGSGDALWLALGATHGYDAAAAALNARIGTVIRGETYELHAK